MKWTKLGLWILGTFGCWSCSGDGFFSLKKEVDLTKLNFEEKTNAMIMLSPENQYQFAQFFRTVPISNYPRGFNRSFFLDEDFKDYFMTDGDVQMWDVAAPANRLTFTKTDTAYWLDYAKLPIQEGHTYVVEARFPSREPVRAQTTIPRGVKNMVLTDIKVRSRVDSDCLAQIEFDDPEEERNYYIFEINLALYEQILPPYSGKNPPQEADPLEYLYYVGSGPVGGFENVATDAFFNGTRMHVDVGVECGIFTEALSFLTRYDDFYLIPHRRVGYAVIEARVLSVSEDYYHYYDFLRDEEGGGPFFEPSVYPSNVEGAIGIISGYRVSRYTENALSFIPDGWAEPDPDAQ